MEARVKLVGFREDGLAAADLGEVEHLDLAYTGGAVGDSVELHVLLRETELGVLRGGFNV